MAMKNGRITRRRIMETVLTLEKLQPILEDIKDLIRSTAKGTETVLRTEFQKEINGIKNEINGIKNEINGIKNEISGIRNEIRGIKEELRLTQAAVLENSRAIKKLEKSLEDGFAELRDEMHKMEKRLSEKIDGNSRRLEDHETRIGSLEKVS